MERTAESVLARFGLTRVPVAANDDRLYNAFRRTASKAGVAAITGMDVAGLRERLAATLEESRARIPQDVLLDAYQSWATQEIARAAGPIAPQMLHADNAWRSIANRIRGAGQWADEGEDLALYLAALLFEVQIRVLRPDGTEKMIGNAGSPTTITLYRPPGHWDATEAM